VRLSNYPSTGKTHFYASFRHNSPTMDLTDRYAAALEQFICPALLGSFFNASAPRELIFKQPSPTQAILRVLAREDMNRDLFADPGHDYAKAVQFYQHDMDWANRMILGEWDFMVCREPQHLAEELAQGRA
jgi:hypothetical protein